jgi:hypothetical protein
MTIASLLKVMRVINNLQIRNKQQKSLGIDVNLGLPHVSLPPIGLLDPSHRSSPEPPTVLPHSLKRKGNKRDKKDHLGDYNKELMLRFV